MSADEQTTQVAAAQVPEVTSQKSKTNKKKRPTKQPAEDTEVRALGLSGAATAETGLPRKRFYRQRAHANPLSIHSLVYPLNPRKMNWNPHYPLYFDDKGAATRGKQVEFADIGCGFGGLVTSIAPLFPDTLMLGIEIRTSVTQYVSDKIRALRLQPGSVDPDSPDEIPAWLMGDVIADSTAVVSEKDTGNETNKTEITQGKVKTLDDVKRGLIPPSDYAYQNLSVLRGNAMIHLPNFFSQGQLSKLFFLYPDPQFKQRKHKARIISDGLLAEYAYALRIGGLLYTVTDVPELHDWMVSHLDAFPLFQRLSEEEINCLGLESDEGVQGIQPGPVANARERLVMECVKRRTEEGRKVERNNKGKQWSVWRRIVHGPDHWYDYE